VALREMRAIHSVCETDTDCYVASHYCWAVMVGFLRSDYSPPLCRRALFTTHYCHYY
jgi:hypothetical protein